MCETFCTLSSGGWSGAKTLPLFPRQPSPGNAKKKTSRSLAKRQQRIKQQKPAGMAGFCYVRQNRLPKKSVVSAGTSAGPAETGRPPSRIPRSVAGRRTRPRRELQDSRSYACGCAPNVQLLRKKEPTTPHESETPQRPSEDTGDGRQEANYGGPASSHPPDERVLGKEGGV